MTNKHNNVLKVSTSPRLHEMGLNPFTLSFGGDLEEIFLEDYFRESLKQVWVCLVLANFVWWLFGILDAVLFPEIKGMLWYIRYVVISPGLISITLFSFTHHFKKYMQATLSAMMLLTGLGIITMIVITPQPLSYSYYAGLIIIFMFGYTFLKVRFVWTVVAGWLIVAFYEIASVWISDTPVSVLINNSFFLISANIIAMFACYFIEYYTRRDFFLARLLENTNLELEKRVMERTSQLVKTNRFLNQEITERKRAEKELIQAHKMEAIGTLAGGVAHDFNNILSAIISYSEMGLYKKNMDENNIQYRFEQILKAGNRAKDLVKQILTFSRGQEQESVQVKTGTIVKEALKLLQATLPKNIEIRQNIMTDSDTVLADPIQIHQILMNLCTNAAYSMKGKGGVLEISLNDLYVDSETEAQVSDLPTGQYLKLCVHDTGHGIDRAVMERIFDPYFTTKGKGEGTGLGLSVVHGIARSLGGTITVDGELGKGTTFSVFFPKLEVNETSVAEQENPLPEGNERILFVDDEEVLVDVGQEMLEEFGYNVVTKTSAVEALEIFRAQPEKFDLVITDKNMPHMTGFDFAEELLHIRPNMPVILLTGFSDTADTEKAKAQGFRELVIKPIDMQQMAETIRRVLDNNGQQLPQKVGA